MAQCLSSLPLLATLLRERAQIRDVFGASLSRRVLMLDKRAVATLGFGLKEQSFALRCDAAILLAIGMRQPRNTIK